MRLIFFCLMLYDLAYCCILVGMIDGASVAAQPAKSISEMSRVQGAREALNLGASPVKKITPQPKIIFLRLRREGRVRVAIGELSLDKRGETYGTCMYLSNNVPRKSIQGRWRYFREAA